MFSLRYFFKKEPLLCLYGAEDDMHHGKYTPQQLQQKNSVCTACDRQQWPIVLVTIVLNTCNFGMASDP